MAEAGVPGFEVEQWQAVYVPGGTPKTIVQRLHTEITRILKEPDVAERLAARAVPPGDPAIGVTGRDDDPAVGLDGDGRPDPGWQLHFKLGNFF